MPQTTMFSPSDSKKKTAQCNIPWYQEALLGSGLPIVSSPKRDPHGVV